MLPEVLNIWECSQVVVLLWSFWCGRFATLATQRSKRRMCVLKVFWHLQPREQFQASSFVRRLCPCCLACTALDSFSSLAASPASYFSLLNVSLSSQKKQEPTAPRACRFPQETAAICRFLRHILVFPEVLVGECPTIPTSSGPIHTARTQTQANGTYYCEWECSHWTQATKRISRKKACSRPVCIGPQIATVAKLSAMHRREIMEKLINQHISQKFLAPLGKNSHSNADIRSTNGHDRRAMQRFNMHEIPSPFLKIRANREVKFCFRCF